MSQTEERREKGEINFMSPSVAIEPESITELHVLVSCYMYWLVTVS